MQFEMTTQTPNVRTLVVFGCRAFIRGPHEVPKTNLLTEPLYYQPQQTAIINITKIT